MSEQLQQWLFAGGFAFTFAVGSGLIHHMLHCKGDQNAKSLNDTREDIRLNLRPEISKNRERIHDLANDIHKVAMHVATLEERTK